MHEGADPAEVGQQQQQQDHQHGRRSARQRLFHGDSGSIEFTQQQPDGSQLASPTQHLQQQSQSQQQPRWRQHEPAALQQHEQPSILGSRTVGEGWQQKLPDNAAGRASYEQQLQQPAHPQQQQAALGSAAAAAAQRGEQQPEHAHVVHAHARLQAHQAAADRAAAAAASGSALHTVRWYRDQASRRLTARINAAADLSALRGLLRQYEGA